MISTDRQTTADTQSHKDPHHPATLHLHLYSIGPYTRYCRARRGIWSWRSCSRCGQASDRATCCGFAGQIMTARELRLCNPRPAPAL